MLLEELEIDMDYDKYRYYLLLDELFWKLVMLNGGIK